MEFVETPIFTEEIESLLPPESFRGLQLALLLRPDAGDLIRGSGGLRVIYFWDGRDFIFLLLPYRKNRQEDLTPRQVQQLRAVVKEWIHENK